MSYVMDFCKFVKTYFLIIIELFFRPNTLASYPGNASRSVGFTTPSGHGHGLADEGLADFGPGWQADRAGVLWKIINRPNIKRGNNRAVLRHSGALG